MHSTSNLKKDRLQQQKTTSGSSSVWQEQKAEAAMGTGSTKLDISRPKKNLFLIFAEAHRLNLVPTA